LGRTEGKWGGGRGVMERKIVRGKDRGGWNKKDRRTAPQQMGLYLASLPTAGITVSP